MLVSAVYKFSVIYFLKREPRRFRFLVMEFFDLYPSLEYSISDNSKIKRKIERMKFIILNSVIDEMDMDERKSCK